MDQQLLDDWFKYEAPSQAQQQRYERIRVAAEVFANVINDNTPDLDDQKIVLGKLREVLRGSSILVANDTEG